MSTENITGDLSQYPSGVDYTSVETMLEFGRGQGALQIGVPYKVYRVTSASFGDIIQPANLIYSNFPLTRQKNRDQDGGMESDRMQSIFTYQMMGDFTTLLVGDVLIQNDPVYGAGFTQVTFETVQFNGLCLATNGVLKKPIGARLDRNVTIYRPNTNPDEFGYMNQTLGGALPLICSTGVWDFGEVGDTASKIPSGFLQGRRSKGPIVPSVPDITPKLYWQVYIGPLNGYLPREGDRIVSEEGDRYVVMSPWQQLTGLAGYQLTVEREIAQP